MKEISLADHKHISPIGDYFWAETKDNDFATGIRAMDKEGNKYYIDLTREEMTMLFKGWQQAQVKFDFNKGEKSEDS